MVSEEGFGRLVIDQQIGGAGCTTSNGCSNHRPAMQRRRHRLGPTSVLSCNTVLRNTLFIVFLTVAIINSNNKNNNNDCIRFLTTVESANVSPSSIVDDHNSPNDTSTQTLLSSSTTTTTSSSMESNRSYGFWDPDIELMRQQYWQRTLAEIRTLAQLNNTNRNNNNNKNDYYTSTWGYPKRTLSNTNSTFFNRWKALTTIATTATLPNNNNNNNNNSSANDIDNELSSTATVSERGINDIDDLMDVITEEMMTLSSSTTPAASTTTTTFGWNAMVTPPRFDGFPSWERLLYDWNEDVQEYLQQVNDEQTLGYSIGNYGRAPSVTTTTTMSTTSAATTSNTTSSEANLPSRSSESSNQDSTSTSATTTTLATAPPKVILPPIVVKTVSTIPLPIPAPAKSGDAILDYTDIANKSKSILIVTTASLPWKTGTAVNPLLRAAYLTIGRKPAGGNVTLMVPWLERKLDQMSVYGPNNTFTTPFEQEQYIRRWLNESANMPSASQEIHIEWYTAWQNKVENSIYSMGDITANLSSTQYDICILEEPEHLNWYRAPGESWTKKFRHVVGILHTNYFSYALDQPAALIRAPAMRLLCSWMCRAHCHRLIKLSATLDPVAPEKELVENVHGVRGTFLDIGAKVRTMLLRPSPTPIPFISTTTTTTASDSVFCADADPKIYFIGKMLWSKGLGSLMELLKYAEESASLRVAVDMYGGGPDQEAATKKAEKLELEMTFHGALDHAELAYTHKIFVNPSTSEVLCTTSAEALAMGKFVIFPSHPSNDFFAQFPNCLTYATREEFVGELYYAMTHAPEPLSDEYAYALSWEAATQRLEAAGCITVEENEQMQQALSSEAAGIEIALPPIVENEESRKEISKVFRFSRMRYRQFRTRLSQEIQESKGTSDLRLVSP
jgi:digalactosyldiacylglycerol synthase